MDWKATAHTGNLQVREFARERDPLVEIYLDLERVAGGAQGEFEAWFEAAVEACAYLVWSLTRKGARARFRTQTLAVRVPDEGDAYTILKFLALVEPLAAGRGEGLGEVSDDESSDVQVLFSAQAARFEAAGWRVGHVVDWGSLAAGGTGAGAGADGDHGDRKREGGSASVDGDPGRAGDPADAGRESR